MPEKSGTLPPDIPWAVQLKGAQDDIVSWSTRNFGATAVPKFDSIGVLQLAAWAGRIAHGGLKLSQGIRGTPREHIEDMKRASAGAGAAAHKLESQALSAIIGYSPHDGGLLSTAPVGFAVSALLGVVEELGEIAEAVIANDRKATEDGIGDLLVFLLDFCARNQLDAEKILNTTWAKVRLRDWTKNKQTGGEPAS